MNAQPRRRSLRDLLKSKYKSPEALLERLGFSAEEFMPLMAFDSKTGIGSSNMSAPQVKAKDVLSKSMRRSLDAMSPGMRQALRQHLGKGDDLHQPDLHLHVDPHGARDQEEGSGSYLSPALAAALWQHIAPKLDDTNSQEDFHALLQRLCGQSDFHEIADDQLPLLGALGGLGEAAAGAGEAAAGGAGGLSAAEGALIGSAAASGGGGGEEKQSEDQSYLPPQPRNFGGTPRTGGSMTPNKPFPRDTSRQRGAMDSRQQAAFDAAFPEAAHIKILSPAHLEYRDGTPVHEPYRSPRARRLPTSLAMDKAALKAEKAARKEFKREFPMAARIRVI